MSAILEMRRIVKRFGTLMANDHIDLEIGEGEIHALLGENGAGKTTLMNILYGLLLPDEGEIYVRGRKVKVRSPKDAMGQKVGMVSQDFSLIPALTVSENIVLSDIPTSNLFLLNRDLCRKRVLRLAESHGFELDPDAKVEHLSVGEQQRVEILKSLYQNIEIFVLDEPTAVLVSREVEELFRALRSMIEQGGRSVIFITHKLGEAMSCDRITVLRTGKVVLRENTKNVTKEDLTKAMFKEKLSFATPDSAISYARKNGKENRPLLKVKDLGATDARGVSVLQGVSFDVFPGEIFGVAGVAGNGQRELAEVIAGLHKAGRGKVLLKGEDVTNCSPKSCRERGLRYIPEQRLKNGLFDNLSAADNLILGREDKPPFGGSLLLDFAAIRDFSKKAIARFDVKVGSIKTLAKNLSGGNLQKLLLARELGYDLDLLIAAQPTRGLDMKSYQFVHAVLVQQKTEGKGVLLISYNLDEIMELSDRIGIMYKGKMMVVLSQEIRRGEIEKTMVAGMEEKHD